MAETTITAQVDTPLRPISKDGLVGFGSFCQSQPQRDQVFEGKNGL